MVHPVTESAKYRGGREATRRLRERRAERPVNERSRARERISRLAATGAIQEAFGHERLRSLACALAYACDAARELGSAT